MKKESINTRQTITNITAGLVVGLIFVVISISLATLVFSGELRAYLSRGIGLFLFSGFILSVILVSFGKFHGATIAPQDGPAALLAVAAGGIASALIGSENPETAFYTVAAGIILCSLVTGAAFFLIGQFKLGNLVRYIPYPVVGGFLAGTGWLLTSGAIEVMTGQSLGMQTLSLLFQSGMLIRWLPGTIFAIIVLIVVRRSNHFLIWPGIVASALLIFYASLYLTGTSIEQARSVGLLLQPFPSGGLWVPFTISNINLVDWNVLASQSTKLIPIPLVSLIAFLLNTTGLELVAKRDIDVNHELRVTGMANVVAGLGGGPIGYHMLGATSLAQRMGAKTRVVTITAGLICGLVLLVGGGFISYLPVALLTSLLLVLGLSFLMDWIYDAWFKMPKTEYLVVIVSLVVIAFVGFLEGVMAGIIAATILFVVKYSRVNTVRDSLNGTIYHAKVDRPPQQRIILKEFGRGIHIYRLQGYIFFGTANALYSRVREILEDTSAREHFILLDFHRVHGFDSSAVSSFTRMRQLANLHDIHLVVTQVPDEILHQMKLGGFEADERVHIFRSLDHGMEWCENKLLASHEQSTQFLNTKIVAQLRITFPKPELIDKLVGYLERMEVEKDQCLLKKGAAPDAMYFIEAGQLSIYIDSAHGESIRVRKIRSGTMVGEMGLYLRTERTANVYTDDKCVLYRLSFESLHDMEMKDPDVASALHEWIAKQLAERMADNNRTIEALLD